MATVFSAVDESTGRRVALKRLTKNDSRRMATLFEREFYVLSSLEHPRIIEVYDYGVDADGPYYTMELLEGSDLRELSPLAPALACRYLRDVASSLALLHARRLLHRDVSPRNVRTLPDGGCKLIDFGALASFGVSEDLVGTPPAIPPEALYGETMDQRADLFSFGALAYYVLTGRHAFPVRKVNQLTAAWRGSPAPPSQHAPEVSPELDQLVLSLLSMDALARPSSAAEVIDRLNTVGGLEPAHEEQAAGSYFIGAALVDRKTELERVERRLDRVREGRGGAIFVDAEAGVGKSRFVGEVGLRAELLGMTVLRATSSRHSGAFSTARTLVQHLFRLLPNAVEKVFAAEPSALGTIWPELFSELDLDANEATDQPLVASQTRAIEALPEAIERGIREVARKHALVIVVDDVDHADPESAALLLMLSRMARNESLFVITTALIRTRNDYSPAVRALREGGTAIRLRELSEPGVAELVRTAFGDVPHVLRTASRLYGATNGNPAHCMQLFELWVATGVVRYAAGSWTLPLQIPSSALPPVALVMEDRLLHCSENAHRVAATLSVLDRSAPLDTCVALEAPYLSSRDVIAALEELARADVLLHGPEGYRFANAGLCTSVLARLSDDSRRTIHVRVAESLLDGSERNPAAGMAAGLHLIRAGHEMRGADLIARLARKMLERKDAPRLFAKRSDALEAALDVYRRGARSNLALLDLLVPLVQASYEISPTFAFRYGDEAILCLERALGLSASCDGPREYDRAGLFAALGKAPVFDDGEARTESTPDAVVLVGWLVRTVMTLVAVSSAVIDRSREERFAEALRPFTVLGPSHVASAAHEYCRLVIGMTEDSYSASHAGWSSMLERIFDAGFPPETQRALRVGALYSLAVLETQRDDEGAVARLQEIERAGPRNGAAIANQLRFLYHGFRGELELAERYRDRVEAHAAQHGSAWHVEIWSTSTMSAVYGNAHDAAGNKRVVDHLERLKNTWPSLEVFWERAVATQHLLTGAPARAIEGYEKSLAKAPSRTVAGWSAVRGGLARAYNEVGDHRAAKRICEETWLLNRDDYRYVAMTLLARTEYCRALAGLGDFEGARAALAELFDVHGPNESPSTLGVLHRTGAEIAKVEGDTLAFERHLAAMRDWYFPTKNPALIAQYDRLRRSVSTGATWNTARSSTSMFSTLANTFALSVLASCDGGEARKQRALELVAARAGAKEAWLFTAGERQEPVVVGRLGVSEPPVDLLTLVGSSFEELTEDANETELVSTRSEGARATEPAVPMDGYRLLPLTVNHGARRWLVGTIAVAMHDALEPVSYEFLEDMAAQLFQAGDVGAVRAVG
jgi:tetratricopeptide (TPR) repeat protein